MPITLNALHRTAWQAVVCLLLSLAPTFTTAEPRPVLITIDDLPITPTRLHEDTAGRRQLTERLLAVLAKHQIQAVGLVTWRNVRNEDDRELLNLWLDAGHELGNHSFNHLSYSNTDTATYIADVESARKHLAEFLWTSHHRAHSDVRFFRFPQLHEGETPAKLNAMRQYLRETAQRNLPVTLDHADWTFDEPWIEAERAGDQAAMARIAEEFHDSLRLSIRHHERRGDTLLGRTAPQILLLHANAVGAAQWDRLFTWLEERGAHFDSADDVLADPAFKEPHNHVSPRGFGLWDRLTLEREQRNARRDIAHLLGEQSAAWSRGDLETFTSVYSDNCSFVSPTGLTRGRQHVLERYRRRYPNKAAMGHLALEMLEFEPMWGIDTSMVGDSRPSGVHGASVVGRWRLTYPEGAERGTAEGLTLLVLHHRNGKWKIVQDASM
jgi:peptidoglycan/xylan/chitin deacetylase (PgdA/CDA1 family)/ketosteroid isomerase-like protein